MHVDFFYRGNRVLFITPVMIKRPVIFLPSNTLSDMRDAEKRTNFFY